MIEYEMIIRLGSFVGVLALCIVAETLYPRRKLKIDKKSRWRRNLSLVIINGLVFR